MLTEHEPERIEKVESVEVHLVTNKGKKTLCFAIEENDQQYVSMKMEQESRYNYSGLFRYHDTKVVFPCKTTIEFPATDMTIKT